MKTQPEGKVITGMTEPEKRSVRRWCVEQTIKKADGMPIDNIPDCAEIIYQYIVSGNESEL